MVSWIRILKEAGDPTASCSSSLLLRQLHRAAAARLLVPVVVVFQMVDLRGKDSHQVEDVKLSGFISLWHLGGG